MATNKIITAEMSPTKKMAAAIAKAMVMTTRTAAQKAPATVLTKAKPTMMEKAPPTAKSAEPEKAPAKATVKGKVKAPTTEKAAATEKTPAMIHKPVAIPWQIVITKKTTRNINRIHPPIGGNELG